MATGVWNQEWLSANAQRSYPLAASATCQDTTNNFKLPDSFIVELFLSIHSGLTVSPGRFYIGEIGVYSTGYSVVIRYLPDVGDSVIVASAQIAKISHTTNQTYNLTGIGDFSDCTGRITIGDITDIDLQPPGLWRFGLEDTRLEADAVRPIIRGVSALYFANGADLSGPYYGDIIFQSGSNYRIDYTENDGNPSLVFNAIEGEGLTETCVCDADNTPPIRTINNVEPDENGNITLTGNQCIDFENITNGLLLKDLCSSSCCGCAEGEILTKALEGFGEQATTLMQFLQRLEVSVTQMDAVVLGSRLGDRACTND